VPAPWADVPLTRFLHPSLRLRLLAPAIALIVAATMIPTGLRYPSLSHIDPNFDAADFVNNLALYLPLGIALSGSSLIRAFLFGLALSTSAEVLQLGYIDRIPSFFDIASNTCGALIGCVAARAFVRATAYDPKSLPVYRPIAIAGIPIALLGTIMLVHHHPWPDFSNWSPTYHLAIGNELTGDRPWVGNVSALQIYPFAMAPSQIGDLARRAATDQPGDKPPLALPAGGLVPPTDFTTGIGRPVLSPQQEVAFYSALVKQSRLTLLVSLRPGNLEQSGPARIITYSQNGFNRNFTLGQIHNRLTFRLRTPTTGSNGTDPALFSGPVLSLNRACFVAAVYDGRISRLYVDGELAAQADLGARRPRFPWRVLSRLPASIPIRVIELGGAEMLFSGLFALGVFALSGVPRRRSMRLLAGLAAGVAIGGATWIFGVSAAGLGIRILLECAAAGWVIAASVETQTAD